MVWIGKWQHVKETTEIGEGKLFSPGNLRATFDNPDYDKVSFYLFLKGLRFEKNISILFRDLTKVQPSLTTFMCSISTADQLLCEGKIHIEIHRRNGSRCQPGFRPFLSIFLIILLMECLKSRDTVFCASILKI